MENANKNPIPNNVPFSPENQPTPEQKKKGWERRQEAQKIMDEFMAKGEMSYKEIKDLLDDIKVHPENHTLREVKIANYLMSTKYTIDWLDRHVSKAPTEVDVTSKGKQLEGIKVEIVNPRGEEDVPTIETN